MSGKALSAGVLECEPQGVHFEPQRASVRAGSQWIADDSSPHASALRLKIYKVIVI